MAEIDWKKRKVSVLFLCDLEEPHCSCNEIFCGSMCKHTTNQNHAIMFHAYVNDPLKFLNERCVSYVTEDRVVFEEVDDANQGCHFV